MELESCMSWLLMMSCMSAHHMFTLAYAQFNASVIWHDEAVIWHDEADVQRSALQIATVSLSQSHVAMLLASCLQVPYCAGQHA